MRYALKDCTRRSGATRLLLLPMRKPVRMATAGRRATAHACRHADAAITSCNAGEEDQKDCCVLLASYFGPNATAGAGASANCFCDATVWAETLEREKKSYLTYATYFDTCTCDTLHLDCCSPAVHMLPSPPGPALLLCHLKRMHVSSRNVQYSKASLSSCMHPSRPQGPGTPSVLL